VKSHGRDALLRRVGEEIKSIILLEDSEASPAPSRDNGFLLHTSTRQVLSYAPRDKHKSP
jgi:hypothetical protein